MTKITVKAFETHVEEILLGQSCRTSGTIAEWDKELALFPARIFAFLQDTQADFWRQIRVLYKPLGYQHNGPDSQHKGDRFIRKGGHSIRNEPDSIRSKRDSIRNEPNSIQKAETNA